MKTRSLLLAFLAISPIFSAGLHADPQADDLNAKFLAARGKGQYEQAQQYICDAAKIDPKYSSTCASVSTYVDARLKSFQHSYDVGQAYFAHKEWTKAMDAFYDIGFGPHYAEAQTLYAQAKAYSLAPPDSSGDMLKAARTAFDNNDFDTAEADLKQVKSADLQSQVQDLLNNIKNYKSYMQQGTALETNKKYTEAAQKYSAALSIKSNGPGNPEARLKLMTAQATVSKPTGAPQPVDTLAKVKVYMDEARDNKAKGNWQGVLTGVDRALAIDPRNVEAISLRADAQEAIHAQLSHDPKALEDTLVSGIKSYYLSDFSDANTKIDLYIRNGGARSIGAAHFYFGATILSQAIFADPKAKDDASRLQQNAMKEFQQAKQQKFKPVEKAVSPKILAVWNQSGL